MVYRDAAKPKAGWGSYFFGSGAAAAGAPEVPRSQVGLAGYDGLGLLEAPGPSLRRPQPSDFTEDVLCAAAELWLACSAKTVSR